MGGKRLPFLEALADSGIVTVGGLGGKIEVDLGNGKDEEMGLDTGPAEQCEQSTLALHRRLTMLLLE